MSRVVSFRVPMSWVRGVQEKITQMEVYKLETFETNEKCQTPGCFNEQAKTSDGELVWCKCGLYGVCEDCKNKGDMKKDGCCCGASVDKTLEPIEVVVSRDDLVTHLQNHGVFPPPEPQPESVYVYASGLGEPAEDSLKIHVPLDSVLDALDKEHDPICLELDKETMMNQLSMSDVQQLISAISGRSLSDMRALVQWSLEFNKLESVEDAVRLVAVSEIASRPELVHQVFDQVLQTTVLENSELEQFAKRFLGKCYGVDPSIIHLDNGSQEQEHEVVKEPKKDQVALVDQKKDVLESIKEMPELAAIKDQIVSVAPESGYKMARGVEYLSPSDLGRVLQNDNMRALLPTECLYQFNAKYHGFTIWTKNGTFEWRDEHLWKNREHILKLVRDVYIGKYDSPLEYPVHSIGIDNEGRVRCLPHLFLGGSGKKLFVSIFHSLSKLSDKCQRGDEKPLEDYYNKLIASSNGKSKLHHHFLDRPNITPGEFMYFTTPSVRTSALRNKIEGVHWTEIIPEQEPVQKKRKQKKSGNMWLSIE